MPRRSERRLTKRTVDALTVETKDTVFWDRDLAGFGVRVHATGRKGSDDSQQRGAVSLQTGGLMDQFQSYAPSTCPPLRPAPQRRRSPRSA